MVKMNKILELQRAVIKKDWLEINRLENTVVLDRFLLENDSYWQVALMYFGLKNNHKKLNKWIEISKGKVNSEFEKAIFNHYLGIQHFLKNQYKKAKFFFEESYNYLDQHREKIIIDNENYGLDYKGMVMSDLGTTYLRLGQLSKSREILEKANTIFYYKTDNKYRSRSCLMNLGVIELRLHNVWQSKVHFRKVERANIKHLDLKVKINLSFVYYLLRDNREAMDRIKYIEKEYNELSKSQKIYVNMVEALIESQEKSSKYIQYLFEPIDEAITKIEDEELINIYKLQRIIALDSDSKSDVKLIKNQLLPFFINHNYIEYTAMAIEFIERKGG